MFFHYLMVLLGKIKPFAQASFYHALMNVMTSTDEPDLGLKQLV
jgi:hypothetical protein